MRVFAALCENHAPDSRSVTDGDCLKAASRAQLLAADVNGDKTVNVSDAAAIVSIILK